MQTLSNTIIDRIKGNPRIIGKLMALFTKSPDTIGRWINSKDVRLTLPAAVAIIREETGLTDDQILESETADSNAA